MTGILYVCATPIGNLEDVSDHLKRILTEVDYILAEDTRVTLKLLNHLSIKNRIISYNEHSSEHKNQKIIEELQKGMNYAIVSDAGTPCVSDPGAKIVALALENDIVVTPVVGPSAVTAIISVFSKPSLSFHFWGFFPIKSKKKKELLQNMQNIDGIHVFFESPYRVIKTLQSYFIEWDDFDFVVGRELTKKFETFYRGSLSQVLEALQSDPVKGEFVIALSKK